MNRRPIIASDLWSLPRVGAPEASPDGETLLVPVTTHSVDANTARTRIWRVPTDAIDAGGDGADDPARPLTSSDHGASSPRFSPDGSRVAFTRKPGADATGVTHGEVPQLYVMPADGGEPVRVTDLPYGVVDPSWFPTGNRIAFVSYVFRDARGLEETAARKESLDEDKVPVHVTEERVFRIWDHWITDGRTGHLFALDLDDDVLVDLTPELDTLYADDGESGTYDIAPDGREIAFVAPQDGPPLEQLVNAVFRIRIPARLDADTEVSAPRRLSRKGVRATRPRYSPDGHWLVYGIQVELDFYADRVRLVAHDRRSRRTTILTEDWDRSAAGWTFGPAPSGNARNRSRMIYFAAETQGRSALYALDLPDAVRSEKARRPKELVRGGTFTSLAVAGNRLVALRNSLTDPPDVVSYTLGGRGERRVTAFAASAAKGLEMGKVEEYVFDGAEGHPVQMFVVLPPGAKRPKKGGRRLPLVHLIHGGPHGSFGDTWHWRWNAQAVAARGYVAALVNFHGSTGWGQDYAASIHGRWGDQPYRDVMRATDLLLEEGLVNRNRMAVAGGSYGGYLVSWIVSQTDRFAAAVNHAGVSDLQTQYGSDFTHGRQRSIGGEPWGDLEAMDRYNPMRHAEGMTTPMLILHGERDYRVPYVQALQLYNVYKARGLPARLVCYEEENHWILKPQSSIHWYGEVLSWLDRWLGPGRKAT